MFDRARTVRSVCVAVLTTGSRPESLASCLRAIAALDPAAEARLSILVVVNGRNAVDTDLRAMVAQAAPSAEIVIEPRRGIPFSRNRAIRGAIAAGCDLLAFIDDDAAPDPDWFVRIMAALQHAGAEAATGPQEPVFPQGAPAKLREAWVYRARRMPDGSACRWAASNNVIFDLNFVAQAGLSFDETMTTGGSDKVFFLAFTRAGGRIVWAEGAVVREPVAPERLSAAWAATRCWRLGTTGYPIERSARGPIRGAVACLVKAVCYAALGGRSAVAGLLGAPSGLIDARCHIAHSAGFLLGLSPAMRISRYA